MHFPHPGPVINNFVTAEILHQMAHLTIAIRDRYLPPRNRSKMAF